VHTVSQLNYFFKNIYQGILIRGSPNSMRLNMFIRFYFN